MELFLDKSFVTEDRFSADGVLVYVALRKIMDMDISLKNGTQTREYISINRMAFVLLGIQLKYEKAFLDALRNGLKEFEDSGLLEIIWKMDEKCGDEVIVDLKKLYLDTKEDLFVKVSDEEVLKILTMNEVMNKKITMLKYFIALVSCMDWSESMKFKLGLQNLQGKICHMPQSYLAQQADLSERTCQRYNDILVAQKILYIYKSNDKIRDGNSLKQINNCCSRYRDRELCEKYAAFYEGQMGFEHRLYATQKTKKDADQNRRLAQIYNRIKDGHVADYDETTVRQVYKYVDNKNQYLLGQIEDRKSQDREPIGDELGIEELQSQLRDMSVFDQYDFLQGKSRS